MPEARLPGVAGIGMVAGPAACTTECCLQSAPAGAHPAHLALQHIKCCHAGDETARARGTQKSVLERRAPPTFPLVIEMRERVFWVTHWVEDSVDCLLTGKVPIVQVGPGLGSGS